jgi:hypothetical protein
MADEENLKAWRIIKQKPDDIMRGYLPTRMAASYLIAAMSSARQ